MDPIGKAIHAFYFHNDTHQLQVNSNYTEDEELDPAWFFRTFDQLPLPEKEALKLCKGTVLDVGAGAGAHSLILQERGIDVVALDRSSFAVEVMLHRGVKKVVKASIYDYTTAGFDTIVLLMNGAGIAGTLKGMGVLLAHLKRLLNKDGVVLMDSSDISYLFREEDGSAWIDLTQENYHGEMQYEVTWHSGETEKFNWLFTDFPTLEASAREEGFNCKLVAEGSNHDYLAMLTVTD